MHRDWRASPPMQYEQVYGYSKTLREERDLAIYISGTLSEQADYAARMAAGYACPSCATPFPAPCDLASLAVWRAEAPNLFAVEFMDRAASSRIANGFCPFCEIEVSAAAFDMLVSGLGKPK